MRLRAYAWPEGHWDWYRHLAFKHGVRTEQFIHVGGQVDKTSRGDPLNPDDLPTQIGVVVRHIDTVLREFGGHLADTVKLTAFLRGRRRSGRDLVRRGGGRSVQGERPRCGMLRAGARAVPLPWLALPGMRVEIEAVAMLGEYGQSFDRDSASPDGVRELPAPLNHALRCGGHVFVGGQSAAGGDSGTGALAYERLADALGKLARHRLTSSGSPRGTQARRRPRFGPRTSSVTSRRSNARTSSCPRRGSRRNTSCA